MSNDTRRLWVSSQGGWSRSTCSTALAVSRLSARSAMRQHDTEWDIARGAFSSHTERRARPAARARWTVNRDSKKDDLGNRRYLPSQMPRISLRTREDAVYALSSGYRVGFLDAVTGSRLERR